MQNQTLSIRQSFENYHGEIMNPTREELRVKLWAKTEHISRIRSHLTLRCTDLEP
jgi:hypothetical protein